jgi:hypothetical protein
MKQIPDNKDIEMFDNGVLYIKVHLVTVPLVHFHTYEEVCSLAQMHNVVNINKSDGLIQLMFPNKHNAETFAKKVNER